IVAVEIELQAACWIEARGFLSRVLLELHMQPVAERGGALDHDSFSTRDSGSASGATGARCSLRRRAANISLSICRLIHLLARGGAVPHQPSRCICNAAATKRFATSAKSSSV